MVEMQCRHAKSDWRRPGITQSFRHAVRLLRHQSRTPTRKAAGIWGGMLDPGLLSNGQPPGDVACRPDFSGLWDRLHDGERLPADARLCVRLTAGHDAERSQVVDNPAHVTRERS